MDISLKKKIFATSKIAMLLAAFLVPPLTPAKKHAIFSTYSNPGRYWWCSFAAPEFATLFHLVGTCGKSSLAISHCFYSKFWHQI